jgi:hypothetical protein
MTTQYERRCLTLLRAYPPRYRATRGEELIGTLLDAATPGREVPSIRESWDVIRGGLMTRWRAHPPVWRWLLYRVSNARLPYAYRWWARDDILGRWFSVRSNLGHLLFSCPISIGLVVGERAVFSVQHGIPYRSPLPHGNGWWWIAIIFAAFVLVPIPGLAKRGRRLALKKHEFLPDGTPFEAASMWGPVWPQQATPGIPPASSTPVAQPPVVPAAAVPDSWPPSGHIPASWPPMVPPVAARMRRPRPPGDETSRPADPWWPPE